MRMLPLTASIRIPWASGAVAPTLQSGYALQDGLPATSVCAEAVNAQVAAPVKAHVCVKYEIQAGRRSRLWQRGGCPIYIWQLPVGISSSYHRGPAILAPFVQVPQPPYIPC